MKRLLFIALCCLLPLMGAAQATRPVRGVVFDGSGVPMAGATLTAIGSTASQVSGVDGTFEMMVSPYTKFVEASKEGYITAQAEVDGSYLVFKLQVDKKYAENKAKAEEEARKAAEAEKARLAAEAEAARLAAEKAEQERKAAEERKRIEEEKRIAAEKAAAEKAERDRLAAEAKAKAEEERRIAAEKAAAEKAEAAKRAAEEKARIAEEKRIAAEKAAAEKAERERLAAEKAAAEKAEKARLAAEAKAKAEAEKRLAAERAAAERAAAEQSRLATQQQQQQTQSVADAQAEAARLEKLAQEQAKREAELAKKQALKVEREKRAAKWKEASLKGYRSYVDASWAIDSYSLMMSGGLHYIGGYQANNCIFFGIGTGINLAQTYEWNRQESQLSPNSWNVPIYAYLRTNFINNRCSPFFALSAGYQFSTRREVLVAFDQPVKYKTSAIFVNPQLGVDFRINPKHSIYVAAGATLFQRPEIIEVTPMTATFGSGLGWGIDLHLGFTF